MGRGHLVFLSQGGVDHLGTGDGELRKGKNCLLVKLLMYSSPPWFHMMEGGRLDPQN